MTLSTAKLLKENGFIVNTYWCWANAIFWEFMETDRACENGYDYCPDPSTDELLAELNKVTLTKVGNNYSAIYFGDSPMECRAVEDLTDPAECLALLWIKLKQENIGG